MAKLSVTTSLATEVKLSPKVRAQLRTQLFAAAEKRRQIKKLEADLDEIKSYAEQVFIDADEIDALINGADIDGFKIKMVQGKSSRLDKKRLVELGCDPKWIEKATKTTENKPYVKITPPGENDGSD